MKLSIRDLLLITAVMALAMGWMVDRYRLAWRYEKVVDTNEQLRALLDTADPEWYSRREHIPPITRLDRKPNSTAAYVTGAALFGLALLLIVLAWQRRIDWGLLNRRCR